MTVSAYASGTQSATVTTEHFLSSPNVEGTFQLVVDLVNMVAGDVLELRVYQMVLTGGTQRVRDLYGFSGPQDAQAYIFNSNPVYNELTDTNALRFSLKQTFGTSRDFPWKVLQLDAVPADSDLSAILADSIPADGTRPSAFQALYMMNQFLTEKSVSGTTMTIKKVDGSTTLMTLTLSDATNPVSITRAT